MKKSLVSVGLVIVGVLGFITYYIKNERSRADYVLYGNVYTGVNNKTQKSLAIKDDKIIFVGSSSEVKKYISEDTKIEKYNDGLILSGFTDTHTHITPYMAAQEYQFDLSNAKTVEEYISIIKDFISKNPNNEMYIGRGFNNMLFENGVPSKDILDSISIDKPIYLKSGDGHSCWINSKMIELIGVNEDTENPIGGTVVKDSKGNLTGWFKDSAMDLYVKPYVIPNTIEQNKTSILKAQDYYASLGYTSYIEVFVEPYNANYNLYKAYEELDREGKLKLRVHGAWNVTNDEDALNIVNKLIKYKEESKGGMFELTDIKIFMDGVAETGTAYFSEPYSNNSTNYGADRWPGEVSFNRLKDIIVLANKNNMVVHFHAIGDAAITKTLDVIEEARKEYKNTKVHNVITHLETVKQSDFKRFKDLDIVVAANLSWGCKTSPLYEEVEVNYLGEDRAEKAYPYKSVLDSGAVVSSATDYPAGASVDPILSFLVAVNRNASLDETNVRDATQKMTVSEAINSLTYSGAYQMRQENIRGTIEVGKKADIIVLDKNLLKHHSIKDYGTKVLKTIVDGKEAYSEK